MSIYLDFDGIGDKRTYEFVKEYYDVKYLTAAYFHSAINTGCKTIVFEVPGWLELELVEVNFGNFDIHKSKSTNKKGHTVITYSLNDVRAIKTEKLVSGYAQSLPHILLVHKNHKANGKGETLFSSTHDLYNWYRGLVKDIGNKSDTLQSLVDSLTVSANSDKEKIEHIFYWVQDHIRYLAYEDGIMGFVPESVQKVYHNRYGDCKGMANLTCEMLKLAGFDARLSWIGTRSKPYNYEIPSLIVDNHMIATLYHANNTYFLDATEKGIAVGDYAHRIQGQDVLIENGNSFIVDTVPEFDKEHNTREMVLDLVLVDDRLEGVGKTTYRGEEKNGLFYLAENTPLLELENSMIETISHADKNIDVSQIQYSGLNKRMEPVLIEYRIVVKNQTTKLSNETYLNADFDRIFANHNVETSRITDLDFHYKVDLDRVCNIKLPAGYSVSYVPDAINEETDEYRFFLNYEYDNSKNTIRYTKRISIKKGTVEAKNIPDWNECISALNQFYNNQIIITKTKID